MRRRHRGGDHGLLAIEELIRGGTGEEAFEVVFALVAARVCAERVGSPIESVQDARRWVRRARVAFPWAELRTEIAIDDGLLGRIVSLVGAIPIAEDGLDACFEVLATRVSKGEKGQYFTPRHVVDFTVRAMGLRARETVLDPACGSGAFLSRASRAARIRSRGLDIDARAVRTARLLLEAGGQRSSAIQRADALRVPRAPRVDVVLTNPPFAGEADTSGFAMRDLVRRPERDLLFLEACVSWLLPGGRMAIILPYNKVAAAQYAGMRAWLVERVRVFAVVSLPQETFSPHTQQRAVILFAKRKKKEEEEEDNGEGGRTMFCVSARAGKDRGGAPTTSPHDLDAGLLGSFLEREGFFA